MAKLKQFDLTKYYRGIELSVICVTTSQKKFAELLDTSTNDVKNYAFCYEPTVLQISFVKLRRPMSFAKSPQLLML